MTPEVSHGADELLADLDYVSAHSERAKRSAAVIRAMQRTIESLQGTVERGNVSLFNANSEVRTLRAEVERLTAANDGLQQRVSVAEKLVSRCRGEMGGLPHSLGYAFTHLPEIDAFLAASSARNEGETP